MRFDVVAHFFERIEQETSRLEITRLLAELLGEAEPYEVSIICNLALGQLNPPYEGTQFNFATKSAIKVVAVIADAQVSEIEQRVKTVGDIGEVLAQVMATTCNANQQCGEGNSPSLQEVYEALCAIEQTVGSGSQEKKMALVIDLLGCVGPVSAKYIVRIMLGTLRLGFSDMTLIDALSWMNSGDKSLRKRIEDAYNICADLGLIGEMLRRSGVDALDAMTIHLGIPIRPAAAERLPTAQAIIDKIGPCVVQPKLDGFRVQIHLDKKRQPEVVRFFSRNLQDMSDMFPDLVPSIMALSVDTLIAEGEVICYDEFGETFLPFQETAKRRRKHGIEQAMQDFPLKLFLFDILYLNGETLLNKTHEERRLRLIAVLGERSESDKLQVISEVSIATSNELEDYFLATVGQGLEGIVAKRPNALYQPGKRNFNWIKFKRQESGHLEDTIDCVILGYYAGEGKRAQFGIGAFLVGIVNHELDVFQTVAKIGTGLKDAQWRELRHRCDALATPMQPRNVRCAKELIPDVWVWPEIVCSVRADEITLSPVHTAGKTQDTLGYALRFPRIMGYREDKKAQDATAIDEVQRLYEDQFI